MNNVVDGGDGVGSHAECDPDGALADLSGDGSDCWVCGEPLEQS